MLIIAVVFLSILNLRTITDLQSKGISLNNMAVWGESTESPIEDPIGEIGDTEECSTELEVTIDERNCSGQWMPIRQLIKATCLSGM